jgi:hypothetical protein
MNEIARIRRGPERPPRRGLAAFEWTVLFTLLFIGGLAGFVALTRAVLRQQDAVGISVEGMNFPAQGSSSGALCNSSSSAIGLAP